MDEIIYQGLFAMSESERAGLIVRLSARAKYHEEQENALDAAARRLKEEERAHARKRQTLQGLIELLNNQ